MTQHFIRLLKLGWKLSGVISRTQWLLGFTGIAGTSWYAAYKAWLFGLPGPLAFGLGWVLCCVGGTFALVWLSYREEQRQRSQPIFKCDFPILERMLHLVEELRDDALNHDSFKPRMTEGLDEMRRYKGIFNSSGFRDSYAMFFHGAECLISNKLLQSRGKERLTETIEPSKMNVTTNYPILKKALDDDYAKRSPRRQ